MMSDKWFPEKYAEFLEEFGHDLKQDMIDQPIFRKLFDVVVYFSKRSNVDCTEEFYPHILQAISVSQREAYEEIREDDKFEKENFSFVFFKEKYKDKIILSMLESINEISNK